MSQIKDIIGSELIVIIEIMGLFLFALCGAFIKELYNNYIRKTNGILFTKVLIATSSSVAITEIIHGFFFAENEQVQVTLGLSFILGILGFEIFERISTVKGLVEFSEDIRTILYNFVIGWRTPVDPPKKYNNDENNNEDTKERK